MQWNVAPDSGAYYVLPEIDVMLSVADHELPSESDLAELQLRFPHTATIVMPPGDHHPELARYFLALRTVYVLAFALCHGIDELLLPMFEGLAESERAASS